jgi:hypothetical protein
MNMGGQFGFSKSSNGKQIVCCIMAASSQLQKRAGFLALLPVVVAYLYSREKACQG